MLKRVKEEKQHSAQSSAALLARKRAEIEKIHLRLQRLLDSLLDGIIERDTYVPEKGTAYESKEVFTGAMLRASDGFQYLARTSEELDN